MSNESLSNACRDHLLRPATTADVPGIVALIDGVYHEYGDVIFLEGADADLLKIDDYYRAPGGEFVVLADSAGRVCAAHAVHPIDKLQGLCTFRRLYMLPELRGTGWGTRLMEWAIEWARAAGFRRVEFWSDTRFTRAHRFFRRLGFAHDGRVRHLGDGSMPYSEYFFAREL